MFDLTCDDYAFVTVFRLVCLGLESANSYWFRDYPVQETVRGTHTFRMKEWKDMEEKGRVKWVKTDLDVCFPKLDSQKTLRSGS